MCDVSEFEFPNDWPAPIPARQVCGIQVLLFMAMTVMTCLTRRTTHCQLQLGSWFLHVVVSSIICISSRAVVDDIRPNALLSLLG